MSKRIGHLQLRDELARRFAAGEWRANPPSDSALAREFGVSSRTVRKALEALECERSAVRDRGSGEFAEGPASEAESARLQLGGEYRVYRIRRVRAEKGGALVAEQAILPAALFPGLADQAELAHRIVDLAKRYGVRLGKAQERIFIGAASPWASKALGLGRSAPVLVLDRVAMTQDRRPAEWRIAERIPPPGLDLELDASRGRRGS